MAEAWFFDLPAELRNTVYELVATTETIVQLRGSHIASHPLLATCRQIHSEASEIFHPQALKWASIEAEIVDHNYSGLISFLMQIPQEDLIKLRHISISSRDTNEVTNEANFDDASCRTWDRFVGDGLHNVARFTITYEHHHEYGS